MKSNKSHVFTLFAFAVFVMVTPRLCAQNANLIHQSSSVIAVSNSSNIPPAELRSNFSEYGKKYIGCRYVSGATGPNTFDCSGFVYTVARESIGYQIPRVVKDIYTYCTIIDDQERQPGDLVFFKTTGSGLVSHIGIYIGRDQFLHCASDGPNTGVIVSSLKESYWKGKYYKTGKFLPSDSSVQSVPSSTEKPASTAASKELKVSPEIAAKHPFLSKVYLDAGLSFDWNFFDANNFRLNFRGIDSMIHARYKGASFQPGLGTSIRCDTGTGCVQIPLVLSMTVGEYFQVFAGPVFTIGTPYLPGDDDKKIKASFLPGIIGVCWNTPSFKIKKTDVCFTQDIHYTVFNKTDGSALSPIKSAAAGLAFSSGVRVTLPLAELL